MKRFLLFVGESYYASGGWGDFKGSFDDAEKAKAAVEADLDGGFSWWHVIDGTNGEVVEKLNGRYCGQLR